MVLPVPEDKDRRDATLHAYDRWLWDVTRPEELEGRLAHPLVFVGRTDDTVLCPMPVCQRVSARRCRRAFAVSVLVCCV